MRLKLKCYNCSNEFNANYYTVSCPHCSADLDGNEIKSYFHNQQNNKYNRAADRMEGIGSGMQQAGKGLTQIGCGCSVLFILLIFIGLLFMI